MWIAAFDWRLAVRRLRRVPVATAAAMLLVALTVACSSFVFVTARTLLFRQIPYRDVEQLAILSAPLPHWELFERMRAGSGAISELAAYTERSANLAGSTAFERALIAAVSPAFFSVTGIRPASGRSFGASDFEPRASAVTLITTELWRRRYASAPDVVGQLLKIDGRNHTIVGVLPEEFRTVSELRAVREHPFDTRVAALVPLPASPHAYDANRTDPVFRGFTVVARLVRPGSVERVNADMAPVLDQGRVISQSAGPSAFTPLADAVANGFSAQVAILSAAAVLLWLACCANIANLQLARTEGRVHDMALEAALGAGMGRLARGVVAEALITCAGGGILGLALGWTGLTVARRLVTGVVDVSEAGVDRNVMVIAGVVTVAVAGVLCVLTMIRLHRMTALGRLKSLADSSGSPAHTRMSSMALITQMVLAVVVVVLGALLTRAFVRAASVPQGFAAERVLTAEISLDRTRYWRHAATSYFARIVERLQTVPNVEAVAVCGAVPGGQFDSGTMTKVRGRGFWTDATWVSSQYFAALSIPFVAGGPLVEAPPPGAPRTVVVNEAFAREHWREPAEAVGQRIAWGIRTVAGPDGRPQRGDVEHTIVGVVRDSRESAHGQPPRPRVYAHYSQASPPATQLVLLLRVGSGSPAGVVPALTSVARELDPEQPLYNVVSLAQVIAARHFNQRALAAVMSSFGLVTLLVAVLGAFAAMTDAGACRTREIGIRLSLGASRRSVVFALIRRGLKPVLLGVEGGVFVSVVCVAVIRSSTAVEVPWDVPTLAAAVVLVSAASVGGLLVPAWRALNVDPVRVLRAE